MTQSTVNKLTESQSSVDTQSTNNIENLPDNNVLQDDKLSIKELMFNDSTWISEIFIVILVTAFAAFFGGKIMKKIEKKLDITETKWDNLFVKVAYKPLKTMIWFTGIIIAAEIAIQQTESHLADVISPAKYVAIVLCIAWFLLRFIRKSATNIITENKENPDSSLDEATIHAISKLLTISVVVTTILVIMQTLGFSISGILAFGGVGGVAIGFAAKDLLANFFGSIIIYLDRPFSIGDWIRSPDRNIEGVVEYIGWRQTRIKTFDKRPLYIPNAIFSSIIVENPSRMECRRIYEYIGVRYDDISKVKFIVDNIKEMLKEHKDINQDATMIVNLEKFNESSVDIMLYVFTITKKWEEFHQIKQDVMLKICDIIANCNAEIAVPTTTIHIQDI
ncbi:MAG: mechanosensitive ion channel family protein, partial [Pseudomonadota bacterium]